MARPLTEFATYQATRNVGRYHHWTGPPDVVESWMEQQHKSGGFTISPPPGVINAYDVFLAEEGRGSRRLIDVPNPAYQEGLSELNALIGRITASGHTDSVVALLASLEVDLDRIRFRNSVLPNTQGSRIEARFEHTIEKVAAALARGDDASILLYQPTLEPIAVAVHAISDELLAYLALIHRPFMNCGHGNLRSSSPTFSQRSAGTSSSRQNHGMAATTSSRFPRMSTGQGYGRRMWLNFKKYRPDRKVGIAVARQLLHVKADRGVSHAILATTSDFTSGVYEFVATRLDLDAKNAAAVIEWCRHAGKKLA